MSYKKKAADIMRSLQSDYGDFVISDSKQGSHVDSIKPCKHSCSAL